MSFALTNTALAMPLPPARRAVLLALSDMANAAGVCWPSIATLARRTGQGIAIEPVAPLVERETEPAEAPLKGVEQGQVASQQPHQRHRIRAGPEPLHPGFSGGNAAPQQQTAIEGRILHHQFGMQIGTRDAKAVALTTIPQQQLAMFETTQQFEQQLPRTFIDE